MMRLDEEFDMMFKALDAEAQNYVRGVLRNEFERARKLARPRLRLVASAQVLPGLGKSVVDPIPVGGAG